MDVWNGEAPRNVLSNETIRQALARANSASAHEPMDKPASPKRTSTSGSSRPSSDRRGSERRSSKKPPHANCDCVDCRDLSYRDKQGSTRTDQNGDKVQEWDEEEAPRMHCHVQPGLFDDADTAHPPPPRRSNTQGSSRSERRRSPNNTTSSVNKDGDHVQEWNGSKAPAIRTHYDWDAAENKNFGS